MTSNGVGTCGPDDNQAQAGHLIAQGDELYSIMPMNSGKDYVARKRDLAQPGVQQETIVRRLTPLECERLQGYPDHWTDNGQADSARYRQLGNSIAVPVFEWVAERLVAIDGEVRP